MVFSPCVSRFSSTISACSSANFSRSFCCTCKEKQNKTKREPSGKFLRPVIGSAQQRENIRCPYWRIGSKMKRRLRFYRRLWADRRDPPANDGDFKTHLERAQALLQLDLLHFTPTDGLHPADASGRISPAQVRGHGCWWYTYLRLLADSLIRSRTRW